MKTPYRLEVLKRLCDLLEHEYVNEELTFDLRGAVVRGRNILGEETKPLPFLSILEAPRPDVANYAAEDGPFRSDNWTLLIQGRVLDDKLKPSDDAYYLCAAVEERLSRIVLMEPTRGKPVYPEHHMLGGLITSFHVAPPVVRPPEDKISASAFFFLPVRVGMAVDMRSPYTPGS